MYYFTLEATMYENKIFTNLICFQVAKKVHEKFARKATEESKNDD